MVRPRDDYFVSSAIYVWIADDEVFLFCSIRQGPVLTPDSEVVSTSEPRAILHICQREMLRPLRDQILRLSGFQVDSTLSIKDGLSMFWGRHYDLVLIDV